MASQICQNIWQETANLDPNIGEHVRLFLLHATDRKVFYSDCLSFLQGIGHGEIARQVSVENFGFPFHIVMPTSVPNARYREKVYIDIKCYLDNRIFKNRRIALRYLMAKVGDRMLQAALKEPHRKQQIADMYVSIACLRVQQYRGQHKRNEILNDMMRALPNDVNHTFAKCVFFSKMARTYVSCNNWPRAFHFIFDANTLSSGTDDGFIKTIVCHDHLHIYRDMYAIHRRHVYLDKVVKLYENGMYYTADIDASYCLVWRRSYQLNFAQTLLCIGDNLKIDNNVIIPTNNRLLAKAVLEDVRKTMNEDMETRRAMVFYLCCGRVEDTDDIMLSCRFVETALQLAKDGSFFETDVQNITEYYNHLKRNGPVV